MSQSPTTGRYPAPFPIQANAAALKLQPIRVSCDAYGNMQTRRVISNREGQGGTELAQEIPSANTQWDKEGFLEELASRRGDTEVDVVRAILAWVQTRDLRIALARPGEAPEVPFTAAGTAASHQPCLRLQEKHQEDPKRERRANREEDGTRDQRRRPRWGSVLGWREGSQPARLQHADRGWTYGPSNGWSGAGEEMITKKLPPRSTR